MGAVTTEGISILINESGGGCRDNRRYFNMSHGVGAVTTERYFNSK